MVNRFDEQRERLVARARLDFVDTIDGAQVEWVGGEAVEGVRRQAQHLAAANLLGDVGDHVLVGLGAVDFYDLGPQRVGGRTRLNPRKLTQAWRGLQTAGAEHARL